MSQDSLSGILVGRQVQGEKIKTSVLLASKVEGEVETTLDTPRALLAGLTAGVALGLVLWLGQLITGRRE
jgi:hypothetical protein